MNTPPLVRDLPFKPREEEHYFDYCEFRLKDGTALYIERTTERHPCSDSMQWHCINTSRLRPEAGFRVEDLLTAHTSLDELEAQGVFDHYVLTIGLAEEVPA